MFGGIARNNSPQTVLLDDDEQSLRFERARRDDALTASLNPAEMPIWETAKRLRRFNFNELVKNAETKNKESRIFHFYGNPEAQGLISHEGVRYEVLLTE